MKVSHYMNAINLTPILTVIFLDLIGNTLERNTLFTSHRDQATLRLRWPQRDGGGGNRSTTNDKPSRRCGVTRHAESPIREAAPSRRSETTHPFLIHGGDIGFTSTQGSSYDDACATYPISGAAQESDFSLSLHRLVYSSASSTSRAPTAHLGSNARKRPAKRSRPDSTRLVLTRRVDSTLDPTPRGGPPARATPGLSGIYEKCIMNFPATNRRKHG